MSPAIPTFDFSARFYPELVRALRAYNRRNLPELTDESAHEPLIQLERAFALVGHRDVVLLNTIARECFLSTARTREAVRSHLSLIGYKLREATPAVVEVLARLTRVLDENVLLVPAGSAFATEGRPAVRFEVLADLRLSPTDRLYRLVATEGGIYGPDNAYLAQVGRPFTPWAAPVAGDAIYLAHEEILWDRVDLSFATPAAGLAGVWEYFDDTTSGVFPDAVVDEGSSLLLDLTTLLGTTDLGGARVRVQHIPSGAFEDALSVFESGVNSVRTSLLGQATPSIAAYEYRVSLDWHPLEVEDGTAGWTQDGAVKFDLPQTIEQNWRKTTVAGVPARWLRFRLTTAPTQVPVLNSVHIDRGNQYVLFPAIQGETRTESIGTGTGLPDQVLALAATDVIDGSIRIDVAGQAYSEVAHFLNATAVSKVFVVEAAGGKTQLRFGDGIRGQVPPDGAEVIATCRVGAATDGNVGAGTVRVNSSGVSFLSGITNPRPATGWAAPEGATPESLEAAKRAGPDSLKAGSRAVTTADLEYLATQFVAASGARVAARARAFEEALGPKTVEVVVVGTGGSLVPDDLRAELAVFFNGDSDAGVEGVLVLNQEATVSSFTARKLDVTATVTGGVADKVRNALAQLLSPVARRVDGAGWEWEFGAEVPRSRIVAQVFQVAGVRKVELLEPAADVLLGERELPVLGTLNLSVV